MCNEIFCTDNDGTLVKGDVTEGSKYFIGIPEYLYSIGQVHSVKYPTYANYAKEYFTRINLNDTGALALPYEIYDESQDPYIAEYWETTIQHFFVEYTYNYLKNKLNKYKQVWIVSASPLVYLKPIIKYLPVTRIVAVEPNKIITYGPGKVQRLQEFLPLPKDRRRAILSSTIQKVETLPSLPPPFFGLNNLKLFRLHKLLCDCNRSSIRNLPRQDGDHFLRISNFRRLTRIARS